MPVHPKVSLRNQAGFTVDGRILPLSSQRASCPLSSRCRVDGGRFGALDPSRGFYTSAGFIVRRAERARRVVRFRLLPASVISAGVVGHSTDHGQCTDNQQTAHALDQHCGAETRFPPVRFHQPDSFCVTQHTSPHLGVEIHDGSRCAAECWRQNACMCSSGILP